MFKKLCIIVANCSASLIANCSALLVADYIGVGIMVYSVGRCLDWW
jgi:hypothetical protein